MHEIETKILEVDKDSIEKKLESLGANKISEQRLAVDWYGPKGTPHDGDVPYFLRIRTYGVTGKNEITWKGKSDILGTARKHKEINFTVSSAISAAALFEELGLEKYAHQEKDRVSWTLKEWQFDHDQYPGMPAYLEIEGTSEEHIQEAIQLLDLKNHLTSSEGETALIEKHYGLNWFDMHF